MSHDPDVLRDLIPGGRAGQRSPRCDNHRFVEALLRIARSGGRWRDLPACLRGHQAIERRYCRWIERSVRDGVLAALSAEADRAWILIDSTEVRHAAGARRSKGGAHAQGLGRRILRLSKDPGRPEHQIHVACDALRDPVGAIRCSLAGCRARVNSDRSLDQPRLEPMSGSEPAR